MKKFILMTIGAISLVSCSNDEVVDVKRNVIAFNVVSENASRAGTIYTNSVKPESFIVYAVHHKTNDDASITKSMYIDGAEVVKNGSSYVFKDGEDRYWPETGSLTFYAIVEPHGTYVGDGQNVAHYDRKKCNVNEISYNLLHAESLSGIGNENVNDAIADQQDFIYAVKAGQTKSANSSTPVNLNFRHAYSQIVFNAKIAENQKLYVKVKSINLQNLDVYGTFTLPSVTTDKNVTTSNGETLVNQGTWVALSHPDADTGGYRVVIEDDNQVVSSTTSKSITSGSLALLLLPQKKTVTFIVDCEIYNVSGSAYNPETDVLIFSGGIELTPSVDWKQGFKYIYTLNFGGGESLESISFDMSIDDFIPDTGDNDINVY